MYYFSMKDTIFPIKRYGYIILYITRIANIYAYPNIS